ncbi:LOW QUALITY PROTEIN: hypothetical protein QYF61_006928 [Mycteria americana]|uniref:Uncharacterized protein n=1 Tax=Mycteria americana TaxID=33587 RepID=A0AAN7S7S6_MYCAM|nr:LOW QUALITY PROTEIN: hypothetical protein QYF61_006928 [Mycteria americana]
MLAGLDPLVILYMPCDSTQDDLLHQLPQNQGTLAAKMRTKDIMGNLLTQDMKRADVLSAFFTLVFTGKIRLPGFLCLVAVLPTTAEEDQSRDHLHKRDTYKNVDGPRWDASEYTLRDQAKVIARLLSIIFENV